MIWCAPTRSSWVCTLTFTAVALAVFIANGQVGWLLGLVLAAGNMLGATIWRAHRPQVAAAHAQAHFVCDDTDCGGGGVIILRVA